GEPDLDSHHLEAEPRGIGVCERDEMAHASRQPPSEQQNPGRDRDAPVRASRSEPQASEDDRCESRAASPTPAETIGVVHAPDGTAVRADSLARLIPVASASIVPSLLVAMQ